MKSKESKKKATAKKECIRILIGDDHTVVREGLVSLMKRKSDMAVPDASRQQEPAAR